MISPKSTVDDYWRLLDGWQPFPGVRERCFTPQELAQLHGRQRTDAAGSQPRSVAYCVFENPFARGGGIFQVAWNLALALQASDHRVVVISPHHRRLATTPPRGALVERAKVEVPFGGGRIPVSLVEPDWPALRALKQAGDPPWSRVRWILLDAPGFFNAYGGKDGKSPYTYHDDNQLLRDSLFACAAVPRALRALGLTLEVVVHAQDWEMASCALTVKEALLPDAAGRPPVLERASVVLTSHNPYDRYLPGSKLRLISSRTLPGDTIYQRMIPLTDAPLSTVSRTFARELTEDPLQRHIFAGHLQEILTGHGVVGVDNGPFMEGDPFSAESRAALEGGDPRPLLGEKARSRAAMLRVLDAYRPEGLVLGRIHGGPQVPGEPPPPAADLPDDVPVFMMFGRLDPGQKGFDVLARAIEAQPPGLARFILTPSQPEEAPPFLRDLEQLAASRPGDVVIYPFHMEQGYMEMVSGASYTVWPSLYEPFGGATESYVQGTPLVARCSGGLAQQVIDLDEDPGAGTGFLYREAGDLGGDWRAIQEQRSPEARQRVPLYGAMVSALGVTLARAGATFHHRPDLYARMLANMGTIGERFSWTRAVEEYGRLYRVGCPEEPSGQVA